MEIMTATSTNHKDGDIIKQIEIKKEKIIAVFSANVAVKHNVPDVKKKPL